MRACRHLLGAFSGCVMLLVLGCATTPMRTETVNFTLASLDGGSVQAAQYRGNVVIVSFWATWCTPCKEEIPFLEDLQRRYRDQGLTVALINVDSLDRSAEARAYIRSLNLTALTLFDPDFSVTSYLNPTMDMPAIVVLDRQGRVAMQRRGFSPGEAPEVEQDVLRLLGEH